jgi:hypothetical protein
MRPLLLCVWLMACEQMDPSGDPLAPVEVGQTEAPGPTTAPEAPEVDATATEVPPEDEPFRISSEELQAAAGAIEGGASPEDAIVAAQGGPAATTVEEEVTVEIEQLAVPTAVLPNSADGWPVRLVVTMPSTQPPRAVVGLPDGREIVVTAGDLIPDLGMVVMSVGTASVQMAKVTAAGDHAQIANITLSAMY